MTYRLGIDVGGTKIEGIVLDAKGKEIFRKRIATEQEKGYEAILYRIHEIYQDQLKAISAEKHTLGIGTPGSISSKTSLLKNSNTVCMNGRPLQKDLRKILGRDFEIQNDANCFALAEALQGAGKNKNLVFGVIMGTGCGGGIIYKGELLNGPQHIAGEWGHMSIDPAGPECYCGRRGCVETFISGGGLENRFQKEYQEKISLQEIVRRFRAGDSKTVSFMDVFFDFFGRAMANLINILDPNVVILGGGVSNVEELYTRGVESVRKYIFSDSLETPIVKNKLGDSAGVVGAALIGK